MGKDGVGWCIAYLGGGEINAGADDASPAVDYFVGGRDRGGEGFHDIATLAREWIEEFGNVARVVGHAKGICNGFANSATATYIYIF